MTDHDVQPSRPPPSAAFGDWHGGQVTERALCVLCPNPSPMTLDGTNTWVLLEPGSTEAVVIDPGPLDEGHLRAVVDAVAARGARVAQTILTHGHADHAEGAGRFAELTGAPTRAVGRGHDDLADGDVVTARWAGAAGRRDARSHLRLAVLRPARRPRPAHRRHGPRPRHHGGRAPRR